MISAIMKEAFPASIDDDVRLLVLGSLPGDASLAARQYHANPTNQFWRLIGSVVEEDLLSLRYADRLERLLSRGIGLWDVIKSANRSGSLDAAISDHQANDLNATIAKLPRLRTIAFNGIKASVVGRKQVAAMDRAPALVTLPSSSAAYCAISLEAKRAAWLGLRMHLGERSS